MTNKKTVFISYGRDKEHPEDVEMVRKIKADLEEEGFDVLIDEEQLRTATEQPDGYCLNAMLADFQKAKQELNTTTPNTKEYKKIIHDLGIKALEENSKWVVLHNSMRAKPSLD